jgi:hypothetical protein
MTREEALAKSARELGKELSWLTDGGKFNSRIKKALDSARDALKMGRDDES